MTKIDTSLSPDLQSVKASLQARGPSAESLSKSKTHGELEKAAKDFEGYFMDMVMQSMRSTVDDSNTYGDSEQTKFFQGMLDTEYSKISSKTGYIGLADAIVRQMSRHLIEPKKAP